ncbi:PLD nuclease N-terminal domain-containing protein [uncultured Algoriphagus sp.]|uniref:PLD nuclease N-terminal domain-containing protein n=1 Tax=uncultured Algoriphagus sp. TaxID=417365 RepID=UPI00258DA145|nr:PLD nuclease N-terminal domain-containing protein [uncultured Algoriphagus sp.]
MELITPGQGLWIWQAGGALLLFGYAAFWLYAMVDLIKSDFRAPHEKMMWLLILLFTTPFGVFLYLTLSRRHKEKRKFNPNFSSRLQR